MKIRPVGGVLIHVDERTDRRTYVAKVTGGFGDYGKVLKMQVTQIHSFIEMLCDKQEWVRLETTFLWKNTEYKICTWSYKKSD
jgi:hypothetical protein